MNRGPRSSSARVALCYGTRPQVIKASVLRPMLEARFDVLAIDTGQHYDYELNELLYRQLEVARPDVLLEVGSGEHGEQTAAILTRCAEVLKRERPDVVVVIGDTNSTVGCALAAVKLRIPVVHVEAGLQAADALMPEEINRRAVDAIASVLCAPSVEVAQRLEIQHPDAMIVETGDVARDVLGAAMRRIPDIHALSRVDMALEPGRFIFATLHRADTTDDRGLLQSSLRALAALPFRVFFAAHPRTVAAAARYGVRLDESPNIHVAPPVGYLDSLALTNAAAAVVTDSGGLQREAYWLGVPCFTLRAETEWTETVRLGANRLVPPAQGEAKLPHLVRELLARGRPAWDRTVYGDGHAAEAVAGAITNLVVERLRKVDAHTFRDVPPVAQRA